MIRVLAFSASVALLWAGTALAQDMAKADPAKGKQIATTVCAACHGPDGNSRRQGRCQACQHREKPRHKTTLKLINPSRDLAKNNTRL